MSSRSHIVHIGSVAIGGGSSIAVQSMTTTDTKDVEATVQQILDLEAAGCDIVRVALYDVECTAAVPRIKDRIHVPVVGDVHFDWRIAVAAIDAGIDKIRINPGNIGSQDKVLRVADAAKAHGVPIRVGANTGSLPRKANVESVGGRLIEGTMANVRLLESVGFHDIVISVKSSDVTECVRVARALFQMVKYPFHLGVTEAGTAQHAIIKSAVGIGTLLLEDIGDTIRVSISGDPVQEVKAAHEILQACGMETPVLEIISCPTCARTGLDVEKLARQVEALAPLCEVPMKVAVMGCVVNGPGEAKRADLGIAGNRNEIVLFEKGRVTGRYPGEQAYAVLEDAIRAFQERRKRVGSNC